MSHNRASNPALPAVGAAAGQVLLVTPAHVTHHGAASGSPMGITGKRPTPSHQLQEQDNLKLSLKGLSHEMEMAFGDMHDQFEAYIGDYIGATMIL
jgi:hypothetical protein